MSRAPKLKSPRRGYGWASDIASYGGVFTVEFCGGTGVVATYIVVLKQNVVSELIVRGVSKGKGKNPRPKNIRWSKKKKSEKITNANRSGGRGNAVPRIWYTRSGNVVRPAARVRRCRVIRSRRHRARRLTPGSTLPVPWTRPCSVPARPGLRGENHGRERLAARWATLPVRRRLRLDISCAAARASGSQTAPQGSTAVTSRAWLLVGYCTVGKCTTPFQRRNV